MTSSFPSSPASPNPSHRLPRSFLSMPLFVLFPFTTPLSDIVASSKASYKSLKKQRKKFYHQIFNKTCCKFYHCSTRQGLQRQPGCTCALVLFSPQAFSGGLNIKQAGMGLPRQLSSFQCSSHNTAPRTLQKNSWHLHLECTYPANSE